jgi:hypothetical protein
VTRDIPVNRDSRLTAPGGLDCLVLELAEGETLAEQIKRSGPLATERLDYARHVWRRRPKRHQVGAPVTQPTIVSCVAEVGGLNLDGCS